MEHDHMIKAMCLTLAKRRQTILENCHKQGIYNMCFERETELAEVEDGHRGDRIALHTIS